MIVAPGRGAWLRGWFDGVRRFAATSPLNAVAVFLVVLVLVAAVFGELLAPYPANQTALTARLEEHEGDDGDRERGHDHAQAHGVTHV